MIMHRILWIAVLGLAGWLAATPAGWAQARPSIGYVYPAGGQQGTTFQVKVGGQALDDVNVARVSGSGVTVKVVEYFRRLNNQEVQLLGEQLKELKKTAAPAAATMMSTDTSMMMSSPAAEQKKPGEKKAAGGKVKDEATLKLIDRIEKRTREFVQTPACASISSLVFVEVTIAPDAEPGARELRLATPRGVSNPLVFHVDQVPESSRKSMIAATLQVLGKEAQSLRKRPAGEVEVRVTVPCTVNGQIASGEVNRYRFEARRGQRLLITTQGRELIPFIADAVPGWFQPVLAIFDAKGKELAYCDDYRFNPDPVIFFDVPQDGEYVFEIHDSIYRGREDFVYRISIGELPFITSIFPLGGPVGSPVTVKMNGWNLQNAALTLPEKFEGPGVHLLAASRQGFVSNAVPFSLDMLPECFDKDSSGGGPLAFLDSIFTGGTDGGANDTREDAQEVRLPVIVNGRIDKTDDWDVYQFVGKADDTVVAEVQARRFDSPLDSVIKLTDADGKLLAFNDDHEDLEAGTNTHHADSYVMAKLPADGKYYVHIGDAARNGGEEYAYRLRISAPQPDFALRVVPSSILLRSKAAANVTVHAIRKDGFTGPITLSLNDPPKGFTAPPVTLADGKMVAQFTVKTDLVSTSEPVNLTIVGSAKIEEREITHEAVPAEDRMQAFLWRHLVPAKDFKAVVFDPAFQPTPKRVAPARPPATPTASTATDSPRAQDPAKPKFTKDQIVGRLKQLKTLYEDELLTDSFYDVKVTECEAAQ